MGMSLLLLLLCACNEAPPAPDPSWLSSADPEQRKEAIYALSLAERQEHLTRLLEMSRDDPDPAVQQLAIGVAGTTGDNAAIPVFLELLHDWEQTGPQLAAATALGNLETVEACEAMLDALVQWPQPPRDMIVNELRDAVARSKKSCEASVRARLKQHPDTMREILDLMRRK